jgi:CO dehydrogenase maturation factor
VNWLPSLHEDNQLNPVITESPLRGTMKLMICGKGGSGKSTVTALLARQYAAEGKRVVVLDTDVSNVGLHRILGTGAPPDLTGYFSGKRSMREAMRNARQNGIPRGTPVLGTWTFDTIPPEYRSGIGNVTLVSVGKIRDAKQFGKGRWIGLARQFLAGLDLTDTDRVIVDTDAGVEHLARNLGEACDAIVMVIDPSHESIRLAPIVSRMAAKVHTPIFFVLNRTDEQSSAILRRSLPENFPIIGEFAQDPGICEAGFKGIALSVDSPAAVSVIENVEGVHAAQIAS